MRKFTKFAAAAAAFTLAATSFGCSAPGAVTIGSGTKTALTVDGYDIRAGIFIYNELSAYDEAAYKIAQKDGAYPSADDIENSRIDDLDASDWIQDKATEYCRQFVATEREFEKVNGSLTADDYTKIDEAVASAKEQDFLGDNGIGEQSIRDLYENNYKLKYLFDYYYGIDKQYGCSEQELKDYYKDNTARIKYLSISLSDSEGNKLEGDELREVEKMIDGYVSQINSVRKKKKKFKEFDKVKADYEEYQKKKQEEATSEAAAEDGSTTDTTVTTTAAADDAWSNEDTTTTTTTTDPFANEVTLAKYTSTTAPVGEAVEVTTSEPSDAEKASTAFNDKVFNDLENYKAVRYDYDSATAYILIKADIEKRMTSDDLWSDEVKENTLNKRYSQDFQDMMKSLADTLSVNKNKKAYKRYAPFKLDLEQS